MYLGAEKVNSARGIFSQVGHKSVHSQLVCMHLCGISAASLEVGAEAVLGTEGVEECGEKATITRSSRRDEMRSHCTPCTVHNEQASERSCKRRPSRNSSPGALNRAFASDRENLLVGKRQLKFEQHLQQGAGGFWLWWARPTQYFSSLAAMPDGLALD